MRENEKINMGIVGSPDNKQERMMESNVFEIPTVYQKYFSDEEKKLSEEEKIRYVKIIDSVKVLVEAAFIQEYGVGAESSPDCLERVGAYVDSYRARVTERYQNYYQDLPQSFNPDEIARDIVLIKHAEDRFAETDGVEMKAEGINETRIKKQQSIFVHDRLKDRQMELLANDTNDLNEKLLEARANVFTLNGELKEAIIGGERDGISGLPNWNAFYKMAHGELKKYFKVDPEKFLGDEEWIEAIKTTSITGPKKYLLSGDVSYLGFVNDISTHGNGNKLLKSVLGKANEVIGDVYRLHGDEFTGIYQDERLLDRMRRAKEEVGNIEDLAGLKKYNLKPNIDMGVASIDEAIAIFNTILADGEKKEQQDPALAQAREVLSRDVQRSFMELWEMIADKRMYRSKIKDRVILMIDRVERGELIRTGISKGAGDLEVAVVEEWLKKKAESVDYDIMLEIDNYVRKKELEKNSSEGEKELIAAYITKYLDADSTL